MAFAVATFVVDPLAVDPFAVDPFVGWVRDLSCWAVVCYHAFRAAVGIAASIDSHIDLGALFLELVAFPAFLAFLEPLALPG